MVVHARRLRQLKSTGWLLAHRVLISITFGSAGIWWCTPLSMSTTFSRDSRNCSCGICGSCRARVSATLQVFHARVILDGAPCRLGEHGDVHDELGVLGADHVVPVVLRVLV